jgi:hypothetical protein
VHLRLVLPSNNAQNSFSPTLLTDASQASPAGGS